MTMGHTHGPVSPDDCIARVLDIAGARPLALDAFLRVTRVEWSTEVTTACIECVDRPRLLLNPTFVQQHCHTPERLAALLLHELAHVSMGHARVYPRPTRAHNVACDAIINREIGAMASERGADVTALTALFVDYYSPTQSPWFLLRPPPGWPYDCDWSASRGTHKALRTIHKRLYDPEGMHVRHTVQYAEIVEALQQAHGDCLDTDRLLGAHGETEFEQTALTGGRDAVGADVLHESLAPISGHMAGSGGAVTSMQVERAARRAELERALRGLLRSCFVHDGTTRRTTWSTRGTRSPLPHHDRRGPARVALARVFGAPRPLLFNDVVQVPQPLPQLATIYLDTSGSMRDVLPALHTALVQLRRELRPRILLFSTAVHEASTADFDAGTLRTTGGTSISPVLEHVAREAEPRGSQHGRLRVGRGRHAHRVLVLTDGYFDAPKVKLERALRASGAEVHLGIAAGGPLHEHEPWVSTSTRLPL